MCLIVYSPTGALVDKAVFNYARGVNSDGIGVMSARGVAKFVGRRSGKRAWRYLRRLAADGGTPYGLHFRWATHGDITRDNCHPFEVPMSDAVVMHNGVIRRTARSATAAISDTRLFIEQFMTVIPEPGTERHFAFFRKVRRWMGGDNKLLVYHRKTGAFTVCGEDEGAWYDGFWYSNDYSLPWEMSLYSRYGAVRRFGDASAKAAACYSLEDGRRHSDYSDRNVSDAVDRSHSQASEYYAGIEYMDGYYEDGADLGARAAARAILDDKNDTEFQAYLKRCEFSVPVT